MSAAVKTEALLLRAVNYGEADRILTLYSPTLGKISCLAKNSRLSRQRFGSTLQHFCKFEALLRPRAGGLGTLESASPGKSWPGLLSDLDRLSAGYRLLELTDALEENGSVHAEFFQALESGLDAVSLEADWDEACLRAEARLLSLAGWAPRLDACVSCRREAPFPAPRFSLSEGGLLCGSCRISGSILKLGPGCGTALQRLFHEEEGSVAAARLPLRRFVEFQLGKASKVDAFENRLQRAL